MTSPRVGGIPAIWYEPGRGAAVVMKPGMVQVQLDSDAIRLMPLPYSMSEREVAELYAEVARRARSRVAGTDDRAADRARRAWAALNGRSVIGPWGKLPIKVQRLWRAVADAVRNGE